MCIWSMLFLNNVNYSFFLSLWGARDSLFSIHQPFQGQGTQNIHLSTGVQQCPWPGPAQVTPMPDGLSRFRTMNFPPFSALLWYSPPSLCECHHSSPWSQVSCIWIFPAHVHCSTNRNSAILLSPPGFLFHLLHLSSILPFPIIFFRSRDFSQRAVSVNITIYKDHLHLQFGWAYTVPSYWLMWCLAQCCDTSVQLGSSKGIALQTLTK